MLSLAQMLKELFQRSLPTQELNLWGFSQNEAEGQVVLEALAQSNHSSLKIFYLIRNDMWWSDDDCVKHLATALKNQNSLEKFRIDGGDISESNATKVFEAIRSSPSLTILKSINIQEFKFP